MKSGPKASSTRPSAKAWADKSGFSLIQVHLDPSDSSTALSRLAERLARRV